MSLEEITPLLEDYVERNSGVVNLEWDPDLSEELLFNPFAKSYNKQRIIAHYFLLVASITETGLIGRAENSRALMIYLYKLLGDDLLTETDARKLQNIINNSIYYKRLGPYKERIPDTLASINIYVNNVAQGDLIRYASSFTEPEDLVRDIAENVDRMDGRFLKKAWMYLSWMTRSYPDLWVFRNFSPSNLSVYMTSYVMDVGCCLGLCPRHDDEWWNNNKNRGEARHKMTDFACKLFPEDPAKVNYPFYLLGRWIRGKKYTKQVLEDYLCFFDELYDKTGTTPVTYDIISRTVSSFEQNIKRELEKTKILFYYESLKFNLPGDITYLPDFVLPRTRINCKEVILEPHGIWARPNPRTVKFGRRKITVPMYGPQTDPDELRFIEKMRSFREIFGEEFYVILLVPSRFKTRVEKWYPGSYDEIYAGRDIPKLLKEIKTR